MALTFNEICERLTYIDEISLMELLELTSEDLVKAFPDKIDAKREQLEEDLEDEAEEY